MAARGPALSAGAGAPVRLAVTCGDPAGIGPEVAAKAIRALGPEERRGVELRMVGDAGAFDAMRDGIGRPSAASGRVAGGALLAAIDLALAGEVDGIVTAPLSKEALKLAGYPWPGHTEALIERSGVARGVMLFAGGGLRVAIATRHVALRDVAALLDAGDLATDLAAMDEGLRRDFALVRPRIAVTGLNPHAGEGGLFGDEDRTIVAPAIAAARALQVDAAGPLPADTAFVRHRKGEFDAVLALYHDQGLIPVKLLSFGGGVNVTLGLPFVRTSPDHGTAYDIAGKDLADPSSMLEALRLAVTLARNRRRAGP